ncbi:MAG: DPP IV N-terminal domain-containing protein, partial [Coprobacter sp.]|nr:DPP IV N-terminal domain-containing protein [Coprobacter sp.]
MKRILYLFLLTIISSAVMAQKKELTFEHLIPGGKQYNRLSPYNKSLKQLSFYGDDCIFLLNDTVYKISPHKKKGKQIWFSFDDVKAAAADNPRIPELNHLSSFEIRSTADGDVVRIPGKKCFFDFLPEQGKTGNVFLFENKDRNLDYHPAKDCYALTQDNGLYILTADGERICVARNDNLNISYGANNVYRNEFGQHKGTCWSPEGNALAFYEMDESDVAEYPLVTVGDSTMARLNAIKYPMTGQKSHKTRIGIFRPDTRQTVYLETGAPRDRYLTNLTWSPDEKEIYIQELNRRQDSCRLTVYSSETGRKLRVLFTDTHEKYVEPEFPLTFIPDKPNQFLWLSRQDGFRHLYLYDTDGNRIKQLTQGAWEVTQVYPSGKKNTIYIESTEASPLESHLYEININTGKRTKITPEEGVHRTKTDRTGRYVIDQYSNGHTPLVQQVIDTKSGKTYPLFSAEDPYRNYNYPTIETGTIMAADDSTELYYRMVKPSDLDPAKKYPVIVYVYGGPHAQLVRNTWKWDVRGFDVYMAQHGYIVFTLDGRGSANRGLNFENVTHRQLGKTEAADQMKGIEFLKTHPFVDADRIGVHGWSFGGFMTTYLMTHYPETFKVGVAGGPVIDWSFYEIMYGERYMGTPQNNPEGYEEAN